jgi:hypothetical protein
MRSRDFRKYVIVTKTPNYSKWFVEEDVDNLEVDFSEDRDKTFWLFVKSTGELVGRFSVKSAPKWVMQIYDILTNES